MKANAPEKIYMPNELLSEEWTRHIEGEDNRLPLNVRATCIVNDAGIADTIVGNVLICRSEMVK